MEFSPVSNFPNTLKMAKFQKVYFKFKLTRFMFTICLIRNKIKDGIIFVKVSEDETKWKKTIASEILSPFQTRFGLVAFSVKSDVCFR